MKDYNQEERQKLVASLQKSSLEKLIEKALPDLREITFHSNGRVIVKSGANSKEPKKLYSSSKIGTWSTKVKESITKLINGNPTMDITKILIKFLEDIKSKYEERGLIPTLELLIEDLKESLGEKK